VEDQERNGEPDRAGREVVAGPDPLILTARLGGAAADWFEARRRAHYPADRNHVPAHLTLFHKLPGDALPEIEDELAECAWRLDPIVARATHLRFTGQGVQVALDAPGLSRLREELAGRWRQWLTPQDLRPFRPHVTLQNKVPAERARRTFDGLCAVFEPFDLDIDGLDLWIYRGGPWDRAGAFELGGAPA
jgi:hypothetical protein